MQCITEIKAGIEPHNVYIPRLVAMLSSLPDQCSIAADLILDTEHLGVDDNTAKESRAQFYIPYRIPPSKSVFVRGLRHSESMQFYVSQMPPATSNHIQSNIVGSG